MTKKGTRFEFLFLFDDILFGKLVDYEAEEVLRAFPGAAFPILNRSFRDCKIICKLLLCHS